MVAVCLLASVSLSSFHMAHGSGSSEVVCVALQTLHKVSQRDSPLHVLIKIHNRDELPEGRFPQSLWQTIVLQGSFFTFTLWRFLTLALEMEQHQI